MGRNLFLYLFLMPQNVIKIYIRGVHKVFGALKENKTWIEKNLELEFIHVYSFKLCTTL